MEHTLTCTDHHCFISKTHRKEGMVGGGGHSSRTGCGRLQCLVRLLMPNSWLHGIAGFAPTMLLMLTYSLTSQMDINISHPHNIGPEIPCMSEYHNTHPTWVKMDSGKRARRHNLHMVLSMGVVDPLHIVGSLYMVLSMGVHCVVDPLQ